MLPQIISSFFLQYRTERDPSETEKLHFICTSGSSAIVGDSEISRPHSNHHSLSSLVRLSHQLPAF